MPEPALFLVSFFVRPQGRFFVPTCLAPWTARAAVVKAGRHFALNTRAALPGHALTASARKFTIRIVGSTMQRKCYFVFLGVTDQGPGNLASILMETIHPQQRRKIRIPRSTTTRALQPPISTAAVVPNSEAITPARKSPSWFEVPVNKEFTALTRPRIMSGVSTWINVCRMTTLTMSATPSTTSTAMAIKKDDDSANVMVANAIDGDAGEHEAAGAAGEWRAGKQYGNRQRSEGRGGTQQPHAHGPVS